MKTKIALFLLAAFLFLPAKTFAAADPNFYIFLCFGQSNMEGAGRIEQQDKTVDARFQVFETVDAPNLSREKAHWYTAVPPLCRSAQASARPIILAERWSPISQRTSALA